VGSIILAQCVAAGLAGLIRLIEPLLSWIITTLLNWVATYPLRSSVSPFAIVSFSWSMATLFLLGTAMNLASAYVIAVWIYSQRIPQYVEQR
jgi:hypothetical protein